ncbi:MAG: hypothetical protein ACM3X7_00620 [Solirubrobacterales bacterium]
MSLDETSSKGDTVVKSEGISVVFDSDLQYYLNGVVIDYSDSWFNRGFSIRGGVQSSC